MAQFINFNQTTVNKSFDFSALGTIEMSANNVHEFTFKYAYYGIGYDHERTLSAESMEEAIFDAKAYANRVNHESISEGKHPVGNVITRIELYEARTRQRVHIEFDKNGNITKMLRA